MKTKSVQYFERKERENTCMVTWENQKKCKVEKGPFNVNFTAALLFQKHAAMLSQSCTSKESFSLHQKKSNKIVITKPTFTTIFPPKFHYVLSIKLRLG